MLPLIVKAATLGFSAASVPSPFKFYLLSQSLRNGWRQTLILALTPIGSDGPIALAVLLLLRAAPARFVDVVRVLGGLFILYLAGRIVHMLYQGDYQYRASPDTVRRSLGQSIALNFLNPTPWLFWSLGIAPIMQEAADVASYGVIIFLLVFYAILIGGLTLLIVAFGALGGIGERVNFWLLAVAAAGLALLGITQLMQAFQSG